MNLFEEPHWYDKGGTLPNANHIEFVPKERRNTNMVCKRPPKGWVCTMDKDHVGTCETIRERVPVHFLRRNEQGQLERLVTDGKWVGWISAERGTRGWVVWQAIAKARGI